MVSSEGSNTCCARFEAMADGLAVLTCNTIDELCSRPTNPANTFKAQELTVLSPDTLDHMTLLYTPLSNNLLFNRETEPTPQYDHPVTESSHHGYLYGEVDLSCCMTSGVIEGSRVTSNSSSSTLMEFH